VLICIRDVEPNEKQPWTPQEVLLNLSKELEDLITEGRIKIIIIPDIESINYGRGVGYDVIEHIPPQDIKEISATKIRQKLRDEGKL
jgi:nicotinamide mononucleotide adenylyltransferase